MIPGEYILASMPIVCNKGRKTVIVVVTNTGDRPVQVGSHYHFFEVNKQMDFDREKSLGMRLNIAAGTAVRFEPGEEKEVELVSFSGHQKLIGFNKLTNNFTKDKSITADAIQKMKADNFKNNMS